MPEWSRDSSLSCSIRDEIPALGICIQTGETAVAGPWSRRGTECLLNSNAVPGSLS